MSANPQPQFDLGYLVHPERAELHTENQIWMDAYPERVFDLAADITRWPKLLPHYRWVHVLQEGRNERVVEMAARRGVFPVKWTSLQRVFPNSRRIIYYHLYGITAGMEVEWQIEPADDGTRVAILHDLNPRARWMRSRYGMWVVGEFFIRSIADRTLRYIKRAAESGAR